MNIEKFTFGMGDRFARQGRAQIQAIVQARDTGLQVHPVWNKSNREHTIIHSRPAEVRAEADAAVRAAGWKDAYYVDADHIGLKTVDGFLEASDFYTLDVAEFTGKPADASSIECFVDEMGKYAGTLTVPGIDTPLMLTADMVEATAQKFLLAIQEAGRIYRHIETKKGRDQFVTEVSIDETDTPQSPCELLLILAMIADEGIPAQTVAPKFTGRFNKGVDYAGDLARFEQEFDEDLAVVAHAVKEFGLPSTLKLSVHSGSDKFSLYPVINRLVKKHGCGLHVKTAGTTWLEEVIGLAESGGAGLRVSQEIYAGAYGRFDELTGPYATVIDVRRDRLPSPGSVAAWSAEEYVSALRHDPLCEGYNPSFRQLIHVGFKVAAEMGERYLNALADNEAVITRNVTHNLYSRHLMPIFR